MKLRSLLAQGPDPDLALPYLDRFVEASGQIPESEEGQRLLGALLSNGGYLADLLLADVAQLPALLADPNLRRPKERARFQQELSAAAGPVRSTGELERVLRRYARREMLRLGAREIGWGNTLEVAAELAYLAEACLAEAVRVCEAQLREGYGEPTSRERAPAFVVLGMGKLGGEELNFSSDIDLIYFYSTDEGQAGSLTLHEYYGRLSKMVTRALGEATEDGRVFRVDLRLRPEGRSGAICNALLAAERYYETFGRTWERQALLRARPVAGDLALGEEFLGLVDSFVYPRSLDGRTVDDVLGLRRLFRESSSSGGYDVKLGAGGIRDVELVAQLLQLLHGGKRRELRERNTPRALRKLALAGLLSDRELRTLTDAYGFMRRVEHRLQIEQGRQTHALPSDRAELGRVARRLGFADGDAFEATLTGYRSGVTAISDTLGEPAGGPSALVLQLLDSAATREQMEANVVKAGFADVAGSTDALELVQSRLPATWLAEILASPDPDRALGHFRDLALRGSVGLFALLQEHPPLTRMLATLFGTSERLSRHLLSNPALWQPLLSGLGDPHPPPESWQKALPTRLGGLDEEDALREMRRYQAEEILRIGIHDVVGNITAAEVSQQLTWLAEACLAASVRQVGARLASRKGAPDAELAVVAMGSFGAGETRYGSDLDLVFLFSEAGETGELDHREWFARLAQRLLGALGALLDEGRLYDVDTRLRPSGNQGLLVTSYAAFDRYHQEDAAAWERVALLRARPVYVGGFGSDATESAPGKPGWNSIARLLEEVTYERPIDVDVLRRDLLHMRDRIEGERAPSRDDPGAVHLRFSPGGLTDLEFLAAFEQLARGRTNPRLRTTSPLGALTELAQQGQLPDGEELLGDYRFLQAASLRLRLLRDRPEDRLASDERAPLARSLGLSQAVFDDELRARMRRIREVWTAVIGAPRG